MKKSEKLLLGVFIALLLLMLGGGGVLYAYRNYMEIQDEVSQLRDQLGNMQACCRAGRQRLEVGRAQRVAR
jgi:cell division protein FtsL